MKNNFYITTPIYYASGKPHIGHAFTTLYADVIARYYKLQGRKVLFVTGTDEHGSKIAEAAEIASKDTQVFVDEIANQYVNMWQVLNINYGDFIRTTSNRHNEGVIEFIKKIYESGDIYSDFYEGLYCVGCENFITEKNLINGLCPNHSKPPQKLKEKNYFFKLSKYLPIVKEKIINDELLVIPKSKKNEILNIIDSNIPDFSITREQVKWGIPFPYDKNQTIYVWVEALMNYVTVLGFSKDKKFQDFWPADVQIIGAEINKFHSIFWPALLMSAKMPLPKTIFVHGLFTINGQKMSKTLGNIIDPIDMIDKFGVDATRYLLLSQFPASEHGDIKESEFLTKYNSDLTNGIGNLFSRVLTMISKYHNDKIDKKSVAVEYISKKIRETEIKYCEHMENYQIFEALKDVTFFATAMDEFINKREPWILYKNKDKELKIVLDSLFLGIEKIANWLEPFMPAKVSTIRDFISLVKTKGLKPEDINLKLNFFPRL